jgi:hypothetical protein
MLKRSQSKQRGFSFGLWEVRTSSVVFLQAMGREDIVDGWSPTDMKAETSKAQPSEKKEWKYPCRLNGTDSHIKVTLWHVSPLLDSDHDISNCTTAIYK